MRTFLLLALNLLLLPLLNGNPQPTDPPEREIRYLSGTDNLHTVTWEFFCTGGRRQGVWTTIEVPSCWEQQGFGTYNYGRDYVTYGRNVRFADEKGIYRHRFTVPETWNGRKINLVFDGSMTDTEVTINGTSAGAVHRGSFYRFSFDITDLVRKGEENLLEVTVSKISSDPSVNRAERYADYWIFGGIFRPVYLESFPEHHIPHATVWGDASGMFHTRVQIAGNLQGREVEIEIVDQAGNSVGICSVQTRPQDTVAMLSADLGDVRLWTAETPHLYKAKIRLKRDQEILYSTSEKFGFRTVEIREGDGIYLNGTKIRMKGINRHTFWPETGRTLNPSIDLMDVTLMKEMNMNAVRCSHYPPDKAFLEICDSLGLYVLDELAGWQNAYSTETGRILVREMVLRDVNHPSIIFWSNGNEGGTNKELDAVFLRYDPTGRQVIHCHHRPGNDFNGIETNHYESYQSTFQILQDSLIYMTAEFLHGQNDGGGGAGLHDYWELMYVSERSGGGFLWALLDEGLVRTDWNGAIDVNKVNAPDGVLGPHREKEGSFHAIRAIFSPVIIDLQQLPEHFSGELPVENRFEFTSLDQCTFRWQLVRFPSPAEQISGHTVLEEGVQRGPHLDPRERGTLELALPTDWKRADALRLEVLDHSGKSLMEWSWPVGNQLEWLAEKLDPEEFPEVEMQESDSLLILIANGISISLSKINGELVEVKNNRNRVTSLSGGPMLCAGNSAFRGLVHFRDGDKYRVEVRYEGNLEEVVWIMHPGGWVEMHYTYSLSGTYDFAGISFDFEEGNVISARWLGQGPYRVWKNRMRGGTYGVWEKAYNNTMAGTPPWDFPEFKGYHADVRWLELNTLDGRIVIACPEPALFIRLFEFYAFPEPTLYPVLPPGDLSFLDAIPPIGTKMSTRINASAESTGPQGHSNTLDGSFTRTLFFNFGIMP